LESDEVSTSCPRMTIRNGAKPEKGDGQFNQNKTRKNTKRSKTLQIWGEEYSTSDTGGGLNFWLLRRRKDGVLRDVRVVASQRGRSAYGADRRR
jgi:hypothetical protein